MVYGDVGDSFALFTSGGTMAHWYAFAMAMNKYKASHGTMDKLVVYMSEETHFCVGKTARLAGVTHVRQISTDANYQIDMDQLYKQILLDVEQQLVPAVLVINAGTVNTGTIDNIEACSQICKQFKMWLHADAAYGGFFLLTETGKNILSKLALVDSVVLDPHKSLFLPFGTGCIVVKEKKHLKQTFGGLSHAKYISPLETATEEFCEEPVEYDIAELSMEGSKPFRGLRVYLPIKVLGIQLFREKLESRIVLANMLCNELQKLPQIEIVTKPVLAVFNFRAISASKTESENAALTRNVMSFVNNKGRCYVHCTVLRKQLVIRVIVNSFRTMECHCVHLIEDVKEALSMPNQ